MVYAGIVTRSSAKMAQHTGYAVEKIIYNKNYNHRSHDSDIALMKLRTPLNFSGQSGRQQHFRNTDVFNAMASVYCSIFSGNKYEKKATSDH